VKYFFTGSKEERVPTKLTVFKFLRWQFVSLPRHYRVDSGVQARLTGRQLIFEPVTLDWDAIFKKIDSYGVDFPPREEQPPMQERDFSAFDEERGSKG